MRFFTEKKDTAVSLLSTPVDRILITGILFLLLTSYLGSNEMSGDQTKNDLSVPVHFFNLLYRDCKQCYLFLAEMDTQKGYLMQFGKEPYALKTIKEFELSSGKQKGAKRSEWDLRTPIGYYEIVQFRPQHTLQEKFGTGAYVLNYPNLLEKAEKRTGSGIWIHGTDRIDFIDYDSEGCIRIKNDELPFLRDYLKPHSSPVIFVERIEWTTIGNLIAAKQSFDKRLDSWLKSREAADIEAYISFYHPSFYSPALKKDFIRWKKYQQKQFEQLQPTEITLDNRQIIHRDDMILVKADETKSDTQTKEATKTLIWKKYNGEWYITLEE